MEEGEGDAGRAVLRRRLVLDACAEAALDRRQLVECTGLSRTTAYRATVELQERGWLEGTTDGYRTTDRGIALAGAADSFLDAIVSIERLGPLFDAIPSPELRANAHLLGDPRVTTVDASNPYRVVERAIERFEAADRARGVSASINDAEALEDAVSMIDAVERLEWIFAESALEAHATVADETFFDSIERPHVSLSVAPDDAIPFSFTVDDDDVSITGHDPNTGLPTVLVESDALAARAWLDSQFEAAAAASTPIADWLEAE
ncbi:hypothetical protein GCM10028857_24080 [Salinarchaeum chitinilyticum]